MLINNGSYYIYEGEIKNNYRDRKIEEVKNIMIHHFACCEQSYDESTLEGYLNSVNNNHKSRLHTKPNAYGNHIAYHIVCDDERIVKLRPYDQIGYHAGVWQWNVESVAIAYVGNLDKTTLSEEGYKNIAKCVSMIREDIGPLSINMHRDVRNTACPGKNFDMNKLVEHLKNTDTKELDGSDSLLYNLIMAIPRHAVNKSFRDELNQCKGNIREKFG